MGYMNYGIERDFVERVKRKMKNNAVKDRIKSVLHGVTAADLQNPSKLSVLVNQASAVLGEPLNAGQKDNIIRFIIAQRIDPNNTFHLIRLWSMFR